VFYCKQNRTIEARKAYLEALRIRRELAGGNPESCLPDVATTLSNLGALNRDQRRMRDAREEYDEALKIYGDFAKQNSEQFSPDVTRVKKLLAELPNLRP
jgi:tetratricopeptide (TPR) repeat protein